MNSLQDVVVAPLVLLGSLTSELHHVEQMKRKGTATSMIFRFLHPTFKVRKLVGQTRFSGFQKSAFFIIVMTSKVHDTSEA